MLFLLFLQPFITHSLSICYFTEYILVFAQGIVRAIRDYQGPLKEHEVTIFVRRGGPNYQEGLRVMGEVGMLHSSYIHTWSPHS